MLSLVPTPTSITLNRERERERERENPKAGFNSRSWAAFPYATTCDVDACCALVFRPDNGSRNMI
jgi:hypothetical protein